MANFWKLLLQLSAVGACLARVSFQTDRRTKKITQLRGVVRAVAVVIAKTQLFIPEELTNRNVLVRKSRTVYEPKQTMAHGRGPVNKVYFCHI